MKYQAVYTEYMLQENVGWLELTIVKYKWIPNALTFILFIVFEYIFCAHLVNIERTIVQKAPIGISWKKPLLGKTYTFTSRFENPFHFFTLQKSLLTPDKN